MNVRLAKDEFASLPGSADYSPVPSSGAEIAERAGVHALARTPGLVGRTRAWFAELWRRHRTMDELPMLTIHELADIGITRSEVPMIFEPGFAEQQVGRRQR